MRMATSLLKVLLLQQVAVNNNLLKVHPRPIIRMAHLLKVAPRRVVKDKMPTNNLAALLWVLGWSRPN